MTPKTLPSVVRNPPAAAATAAAVAAAPAASAVDAPEGGAAAAAANVHAQHFSTDVEAVGSDEEAAEAARAAAALAALPLEDFGETAGTQEDWLEAQDDLDG
ncbi:hypothetical protein Esti_002680 [Eimeria stiedai]